MQTSTETVERALGDFGLAKVMTLGELMALLKCSRRTVQRYLKQWGCLTSYNRNSSCYVLPAVVEFDDNGLWRHGDARFSRYGNLVETVVGLVCDSAAGLTAAELGKLLGVNPYSFISRFGSHPSLYREKFGGRFIYLAAGKSVRARQIATRRAADNKTEHLSDAEAVVVLVDLIKHPDSNCLDLSRRLKPRLPRATPTAVHSLLSSHGLLKKRALDSPRQSR